LPGQSSAFHDDLNDRFKESLKVEMKKQSKYVAARELPSYMQHTESSAKKTREKIINSCQPRRLSVGLGMESFGDARLERVESPTSPGRRKIAPPLVADDLPRYMQPTESSASKMSGEKYKIRPPRIPPGSMRNNMATPNREKTRVQMSNFAMNSFVESLRRDSYPEQTTNNFGRRSRSTSRLKKVKTGPDPTRELEWDDNLPRYQQQTVSSSFRTQRRTRS